MLSITLWSAKSVFDTTFNKFVAALTGGPYCHAEHVFTFTKLEWKDNLLSFDKSYGTINSRAMNLWARIESYSSDIDDNAFISLCFYTIWGSHLSVRMLTQHDDYVFNRLPNPEFTTSTTLKFDDNELRHCLAFSIQELDKAYDSFKAVTYFLPEMFINRPIQPALPSKYFCSEFICYMLKNLGYIKNVIPEKVTPNHLKPILETLDAEVRNKTI